MDNATVSSLYCIALYDNYIALNDKVQKWRNFSKNCWNGTYFYTPRYPAGGGYIVYVRLSVSASLTAYAIPP
jgi:hypothetical protein